MNGTKAAPRAFYQSQHNFGENEPASERSESVAFARQYPTYNRANALSKLNFSVVRLSPIALGTIVSVERLSPIALETIASVERLSPIALETIVSVERLSPIALETIVTIVRH